MLMKKFLSISLVSVAFLLFACDQSKNDSVPTSEKTQEGVFATSPMKIEDNVSKLVELALKNRFGELPIESVSVQNQKAGSQIKISLEEKQEWNDELKQQVQAHLKAWQNAAEMPFLATPFSVLTDITLSDDDETNELVAQMKELEELGLNISLGRGTILWNKATVGVYQISIPGAYNADTYTQCLLSAPIQPFDEERSKTLYQAGYDPYLSLMLAKNSFEVHQAGSSGNTMTLNLMIKALNSPYPNSPASPTSRMDIGGTLHSECNQAANELFPEAFQLISYAKYMQSIEIL